MNCIKCSREAAFILQEWYCHDCFCEVIERRLRKYLRTENPIQKGEHLLVLGVLAQHVLKTLIKDLPVTITTVQTHEELAQSKKQCPETRCVLPYTMEYGLRSFLQGVFEGSGENPSKDIILFLPITMHELRKYVEIKGLQSPVQEHDEFFDVLDKFEEKYPSSKYSLMKSAKAIRQLLEKANVKKLVVSDPLHGHTAKH